MQENNFKYKIGIEPYDGDEPYLFISYSHVDTEKVDGVLRKLDREKFRIWYDDAMEIGDDFREELKQRIIKSCAVIVFISTSSMASKFCGMEIITAFKYDKKIYPLYLEDNIDIPASLRFILENLQHVKSEGIHTEKYIAKLISGLPTEAMRALEVKSGVLVKCKDGSPSITVPSGVTEIGPAAFKNCEKLESINFGDELRTIRNEAFRGCKMLREVRLGKQIKSVGDSVFRDCIKLTSVVIENGEIEVGERAFENCASLSAITLPDNMAEIYGGVFNSCKSLESIKLPESLIVLGESSFADCAKLKEIVIPEHVSKIDDMVFSGCTGLSDVVFAGEVQKFGKNAFKDCLSLKRIFIPASVNFMGMSPFRGCKNLSEIVADPKSKNYKTVENVLFNKSKSKLICFPACSEKTEYEVPDSVTNISDWAFCDCENLKKVTIPDSVSEIGEGAFYNCASLVEVIIPESVTRIDDIAFRGCTAMKKLVIPDSVSEFGWGVLNGCDDVTVICSETSIAAAYCRKKNIKYHSL